MVNLLVLLPRDVLIAGVTRMLYSADIGTWKEGVMVEIDASSPEDAYDKLAQKHGGSNVVQIVEFDTGKYVYDYLNGFVIYKRPGSRR